MENKLTIKLIGTGKYVPKGLITNADLEKMVDTTDEWIVSHTGIKTRHKVEGETTADLAYQAALNAIEKAKFDKEMIDAIIVATITSDFASPSMAAVVQARLGLNHRDITCFDINAACTGFVYALQVAAALLNSPKYRNILVIGAESLTKIMDYTDRNTCILFGDGAGALLVGRGQPQQTVSFYTASEGDMEDVLSVKEVLRMQGRRVFKFAINAIEKSINRLLELDGSRLDMITKIIPHQANYRIVEGVAELKKLPLNKFFLNLEHYGNTSAASIPIALDEYVASTPLQPGDKLMLVGFGAGLTWGGALINI
ncbi:MAG: beta-ketoacyl-ACP synthase III [Bacilli bacterium]